MRPLACWLACLALGMPAAQAAQAAPADANALLLEVRLGPHLLSDGVVAWQSGREVFLPLGEMARLLTIAIRASPADGRASGYILDESRSFSLDIGAHALTVNGHQASFEPAQLRREADDIYVASGALALWLPVDLELDLPTLSLKVRPREQLPLQARFERLARGPAGAAATTAPLPGFALAPTAYRMFDTPFIDQTFSTALTHGDGHGERSASYTAYLTADLLGMEASLYASRRQQDSAGLRLTLGRHDPDAGLLGPLHARSIEAGSVTLAGVEHVSGASQGGAGIALGNRPLDQPSRFDSHTLQGDLPPGWDVELFFNGALVAAQQARADGKYRFEDRPLIYGANEFRLVFHGPLGQVRIERQSFLLEQPVLAPGALYYTLARQRDSEGANRALAQVELGLLPSLSASAALALAPLQGQPGQSQRYASAGLRGYWQAFIVNAEAVRSGDGGTVAQLGLKTRLAGIAVGASRTRLRDFASELYQGGPDRLRTRDELRLDGAPAWLPLLPLSLQLRRDTLVSNQSLLDAQARVSLYSQGTALSNSVHWQSQAGSRSADGMLQASRRLAGVGLSAQLQYELLPLRRLASMALAADRNLADGYQATLGLTRHLRDGQKKVSAALTKSLGSFGLGLNGYYSNRGEFGAGLQLFVALGREPRRAHWLAEAQPMANTGAASLRVFLDQNQNGVMDPGEQPVKGAGFTLNGGAHMARSDADGVVYLPRLAAWQHADLALDPHTLEDPQWQPRQKGVRIVPRPGKVSQLDVAVNLTGDIDGTAYLASEGGRRGIGDLELELRDGAGALVDSVKSAADGYFIIEAVLPGTYRLGVAPAQLARLKLQGPAAQEVRIGPDGAFVNGREVIVRAAP
ncbi:MAG: hypothetical protein ABIT83_02000 [Massilia sp.]